MIMVNLSNYTKYDSYDSYYHQDSYKGGDDDDDEYYSLRGSDLELVVVGHMAEQDESRTCSSEGPQSQHQSQQQQQPGSSSRDVTKDAEEDNDKWLQLGLGGSEPVEPVTTTREGGGSGSGGGGGGELVELNLLPSQQHHHHHHVMKPLPPLHHFVTSTPNINPSFMFQQPITSLGLPPPQYQESHPFGYRPYLWNPMASSTSTMPPPQMGMGIGMGMGMYYHPPPLPPQQPPPPLPLQYQGLEGPSSTMRIIDAPPSRPPRSSVWFMLKASQNQTKEPFLPQIPKSYLRIKDGRMTVSLLMKYLVNKLRLNGESEIEITCRGQQLPPYLTLQYVRDNVWTPSNLVTLTPNPDSSSSSSSSSSSDHVMILNYARSP